MHKTANVLDKLPKSVQPAGKADLREIWAAPDRATAQAAVATFAEKYGTKYAKAVSCLIKDRDALLTFYDFPAEHWDHLRTSNPIESVFATVRHRTVRTKGALSQDTARLMVFKLVMAAAKTWRRLKGENQSRPGRHIPKRRRGHQYACTERRLITTSPSFGYSSPPTGFRRMTPGLLKADRSAEKFTGLPEGVKVHGQLLAAFKAAAPRLGISPRLVHTVDWLFCFTEPQDWEPGARPIVWPSALMQQGSLGLEPTQVKEINRRLIDLGLVTMKDSPNGKRYGNRDPKGRITEAYGFDLSLFAVRYAEFKRLAEEQDAERRAMKTCASGARSRSKPLPRSSKRPRNTGSRPRSGRSSPAKRPTWRGR